MLKPVKYENGKVYSTQVTVNFGNRDFVLAKGKENAGTTLVETPSEDVLPTRFSLEQNHPNPFNPGTTVQFRLPETTEISLEIYNMLGQRIRTLFQGVQQAGTHSAQWDGRNDANVTVAGGVYFLRLHSDSEVRTRRMLLLK